MKKTILISTTAFGLVLPGFAEPTVATPSTPDAKELTGLYKIVSGETASKELPSDRLEGNVRWGQNSITGYDEDHQKLYVATYKLSDDSEPMEIDLTGTIVPDPEASESRTEAERFVSKGLVKRDGDKVTLIYSTEEGATPDDFEPDEGEHKFVFERINENDSGIEQVSID